MEIQSLAGPSRTTLPALTQVPRAAVWRRCKEVQFGDSVVTFAQAAGTYLGLSVR